MTFDYESGSAQGTGPIILSSYCKFKGRRVGTAEGLELINCLLNAFRVNDMQSLVGRTCYVIKDTDEWGSSILGVALVGWDSPRTGFPRELIFKDFFNQEVAA